MTLHKTRSEIGFSRVKKLLEVDILQRTLSDPENILVEGTWHGLSYQEIANSSPYEFSYLNKDVAEVFPEIGKALGENVTKRNFCKVLEAYMAKLCNVDLKDSLDEYLFYGRQDELMQLQNWILKEHSRLILLWGLPGIGKSALLKKLTGEIRGKFEFVLWLSPSDSIQDTIDSWVSFISGEVVTDADMSKLIGLLQAHRCLLILDRAERLLDRTGDYIRQPEAVQDLFDWIAGKRHSSTVVLTSRWLFPNFPRQKSVKRLELQELKREDALSLLKNLGLKGSNHNFAELSDRLYNNPRFLVTIADRILANHAGDVASFLDQGSITLILKNSVSEVMDRELDIEDRDRPVLEHIESKTSITRRDLADRLPRFRARDIFRAIFSLRSQGLIAVDEPERYRAILNIERFKAKLD